MKNWLEYAQNYGEPFNLLPQFIIKDTEEWTDEQVYWVSSGRSPSTGAFVPMELGITTLPAGGCVVQL